MATADGADTEPPDDLDAAIGAIYGGPLDEFVTARDRLARALRAAERRDEASAVRKLAKPKRLAWALDAAVLADRAEFDGVDAAAEALADARTGTDVREATNALAARSPVAGGRGVRARRDIGRRSAGPVRARPRRARGRRRSRSAGGPTCGQAGGRAVRRRVRCVRSRAPGRPAGARPSGAKRDVDADSATSAPPESPPREQARPSAGPGRASAREVKAAERAVEQAESRYDAARSRASDAADAAETAAAELAAAEDRRRSAQRDVEAARERLDRARRDARRAAAEAQEAEDAVREARTSRAELE